MPQLRKPELAAKTPMAFKYTAAYLAEVAVANRRMPYPVIENGSAISIKMPLRFVRSLRIPNPIVTKQAIRYGGTEYSCARVEVHPNSFKIVGMKAPIPWTAELVQKKHQAQHCV